jgi:hypothetical protein
VFRLARVEDDGATEGDHRRSAAAQWERLGKKKAAQQIDFDVPPLPIELAYLWEWFCEISQGISGNGFGPALITWDVLATWALLMGNNPEPWECICIIRLSALRASIEAEKMNKKKSVAGTDRN